MTHHAAWFTWRVAIDDGALCNYLGYRLGCQYRAWFRSGCEHGNYTLGNSHVF